MYKMKKLYVFLFLSLNQFLMGAGVPAEATKPLTSGIGWLTGALFVAVLTLAYMFAGYTYMMGQEEKAKLYMKNITIGGMIVGLAGSLAALFGK
jgi:hypothetical protein